METRDLDLIADWKDKDPELKALWGEHLQLEEELEKFNTRVYLTTQEEIQQKALKKRKLQGRTQIERILVKIRKDQL
jgi:uncharacterized protein YdcH (DUF465 family)